MSRVRVAIHAAVVATALTVVGVAAGASGTTARADQRTRIAGSMKQEFRTNSLNSMVFGVWVNGKLTVDFTDESNSRKRGGIALAAYTGGNGECEVLYDNITGLPS